jgi:hypothetical protein
VENSHDKECITMSQLMSRAKLTFLAMLVAGLATFGFASGASAHTGEWAKFNYCPSTTTGVFKCLHATTTSGTIVLGKKTVPIVNPVTLQGGTSKATEETEFVSKFYGATNGETLTKAAQPVPGGLTGLVNCKEISLGFLRATCESIFENGLTGVNATLELARPASEITTSEVNLLFEEGTALHLPVKVHLENPLLGSNCYVGSSTTPINWNLTVGTTSPPPPNTPITGHAGPIEFLESFQITHLPSAELVDNSWSAPHASGCGGFLVEYILDPILDSQIGTPSAAGKNTTKLTNTIDFALAKQVNEH